LIPVTFGDPRDCNENRPSSVMNISRKYADLAFFGYNFLQGYET